MFDVFSSMKLYITLAIPVLIKAFSPIDEIVLVTVNELAIAVSAKASASIVVINEGISVITNDVHPEKQLVGIVFKDVPLNDIDFSDVHPAKAKVPSFDKAKLKANEDKLVHE